LWFVFFFPKKEWLGEKKTHNYPKNKSQLVKIYFF
jgi:hypothetical protein